VDGVGCDALVESTGPAMLVTRLTIPVTEGGPVVEVVVVRMDDGSVVGDGKVGELVVPGGTGAVG
jgi:hypothetical protein